MVAVTQVEDVKEMCKRLEQQELEAQMSSGKCGGDIYLQQMAGFLFLERLPEAKFLWQRISNSVKEESPEIGRLWEVGKAMWNKDYPSVFKLLMAGTWSDSINPITSELTTRYRNNCFQLVSKTYTTVSLTDLSQYIGLEPEEAATKAEQAGWTVNRKSGMVTPVRQPSTIEFASKKEDSMDREMDQLVNFMSFLEN